MHARELLTLSRPGVRYGGTNETALHKGPSKGSGSMPLENRHLDPGTVLVARYKKKDRTCEVVQADDGLRFRLDDGTEHKSPSSAGKAAMGGVACNGWRFWSLPGTERPAHKPKAAATAKKAAAKAAPKGRGTKPAKGNSRKKSKPKAMRAAAQDDSYGCGACGETFPTMKAATQHALKHTAG